MIPLRKIIPAFMAFVLLLGSAACKERELITPNEEISPSSSVSAPSYIPMPSSVPEELEESEESKEEEHSEESAEEPSSQSIAEETSAESSSQASEPEESTEEESAGESLAQEDPAGSLAAGLAAPFQYTASQVRSLYVHNHRDYSYIPVDSAVADQIISLLHIAGSRSPEEVYAPLEGGLFVVLEDGTKLDYTLVPTAVRVDEDAYVLSQENYDSLLALTNGAISNGASYAQWLVYMTPSRVAAASYHPDSSSNPMAIPADNVISAAGTMANIRVRPGSGNAYTNLQSFDKAQGNTLITLTFESGTVYSMMINNNQLYIQSNDMNYGIYYQLETSQASIEAALSALA